ncbi:MAG: uroporphyrinogen decarboxylase family protein [Massiliimalia sp.]|jgi:hypothetical protein
MTFRENIDAILHYRPFDKFPVVSFGYWNETVEKWASEGHITWEEAHDYIEHGDNHQGDRSIMKKLGFDFNWNSCIGARSDLFPAFEPVVLEQKPDGSQIIRDENGLITLVKPGVVSIPAEIGTSLTDRAVWESEYLPRLKFSMERIPEEILTSLIDDQNREIPVGIHCGSLMGRMRDLLGVEQLSYLMADDPDLYLEILDTMDDLCYQCVEAMLKTGAKFDFGHFWEDICFKNGPLVIPSMFQEYVGPHYKKITSLLNQYGIDIVSLDCDGWIDKLIPTWMENGVNTMFPIEVGTWNANIAPWREQYGKELRGVGGMDKRIFAYDYKAVDAEIERLRPLIELGGYIPCPDHRIAPDAKFENVQYYCDRMQNLIL